MHTTTRWEERKEQEAPTAASRLGSQIVWWLLLIIAIFYSGYAVYMGGIEIAFRFGWLAEAPERTISSVFIVHALAGAVVLISGILQFHPTLRQRQPAWHRALGKTYIFTIWLASLGGLWLALFYDVTLSARLIFIIVALLWFATTTLAYRLARQRQFGRHREWMLRSYALSFFFVTFSFWVEGLAALLPAGYGYPLAVFISWSLNLLVVEFWIRRRRTLPQSLPA